MSASDTGYAFPWEREAMKGYELPENLSLPDQMAYTSLRSVYYDYHEQRLSREAASAEKRKIIATWRKAKGTEAFQKKVEKFRVQVIRSTEMARTAVRKDPSPENALWLCNTLDGIDRTEIML